MRTLLITGVSGYIGSRLCERLSQNGGFEKIIGVDIKPPKEMVEKLTFIEHDIRQSLDPILSQHQVDTVVHAAYVLPPIHDVSLMEDININGARNVLDSCRRFNVSHLVYLSSATAYGFHSDNDIPLTETSKLRGNDDFTYARCKRIIEAMIDEFSERNPDTIVTVYRPCNVVGPGFDNPISHYLERRIVILPKECMPIQFVHEDDLIEIMVKLMEKPSAGVFNIGGAGSVTPDQAVRMLGNYPIHLPFGLLYWLNHIAWVLRLWFLTEAPSPAMKMLRYSWVVSSEKLCTTTGYRYRYNSNEAFASYAESYLKKRKN